MQEPYKKVLDKVVKEFYVQDNVIGLLLFGSLAKRTEHANSDIDLMVIGRDLEVKTVTQLYDGIIVQTLWRSIEDFKIKTVKATRFTPASKDYQVLLDKENWIADFLASDLVKKTWKEPLPMNEKQFILMATDFSLSLGQIKGLLEKGKEIEIVMFLSDYIYLGLELLYDQNKWFLESKKYIFDDLKDKLPDL